MKENEIKIKLDGVEYTAPEARQVAAVLGAMTYREVCEAIETARGLGEGYSVEVR